MNRFTCIAIWAAIPLLHSLPAPAQNPGATQLPEETVRRHYQQIDASVVQIRTVADMEYTYPDPESGLNSVAKRPLSVYGTGVVVGEIFIHGRREYLVLTNHHVADVSNYVISDGRFLRENKHNTRALPSAPEESFIVTPGAEEGSDRDIKLLEIARNPRGDMALLRTVGASRPLTPFPGRIGFREGDIRSGASIITSGFPHSGGKVIAVGHVLETGRLHELGQPHEDFIVDLPVERGQSGSPIFLVESVPGGDEPGVRFTLVGLLHASEKGEKFVVPYTLWKDSLKAAASLTTRMAR